MKQWIFLFLAASLLALPGCGFDDDREYAIETKAGFFLGEDSLSRQRGVAKWTPDGLELDWQSRLKVGAGELSTMVLAEGSVWVGDINSNLLVAGDPETGAEKARITTGVAPHFFAVGDRYIVIADSTQELLVWYHRRKEELFSIELPAPPQRILYNSRTFFVQVGPSDVWVMDEHALADRSRNEFEHPIQFMQFNQFNNIDLVTHDGSQAYTALVSGADYLTARNETAVDYSQIARTPYFEARFGQEWLQDVVLVGNEVQTGNQVIQDQASSFGVDFFESKLFAQTNDSLVRIDLSTRSIEGAYPYTDRILSSVFWRGE